MPWSEKLLVIVLVLAFCVSIGQLAVSRLASPYKQEKGVISEGIVGHIRNINSVYADFNETDRDISELIFSGLVKYDPLKSDYAPDLAEKWELSSNNLTYTFTLRSDALWHDGVPVTLDDVVFTFKEIIKNPGLRNPIIANAFENVMIEKKAQNTIIFTLPRANSYFIPYFTVGILPKHLLADTAINNLEKSPFGQHPIGSGPYRLTTLKISNSGDVADLTAFPQYYGPKPTIEYLRIYTFPNETALLKERGALRTLSRFSPEGEAAVAADPRFATYHYTLNQFTALYFNTTTPVLKDKRVRQALAMGLNKDLLIKAREQRVDSLGLNDRHTEPQFAFNPTGASKLLDTAGLKLGQMNRTTNGRRITRKGDPVVLNLLTLDKMPPDMATQIASQWQQLGIQVNIQAASSDTFPTLTDERRFDILLIRQNLGYNRDVYPIFNSSQSGKNAGGNGGLNFANFKSFKVDALTEALRKEKIFTLKQKLLAELSTAITDETPVIFISTPVYSYALDTRIAPFTPTKLNFHSNRFQVLPYLTFQNL